MASEINEIEAILNNRLRIVVATTGGRIERAVGIDGVRQAAMEIAALRSKDREDGAEEMRERAVQITAKEGELWGSGADVYAQGYGAGCYNCGEAIAALPLSPVRTENGDA